MTLIPPQGAPTVIDTLRDHEASIDVLVEDICLHDEAMTRVGEAINALLVDIEALAKQNDNAMRLAHSALEAAQLSRTEVENLNRELAQKKPWYRRLWSRNANRSQASHQDSADSNKVS